MRNVFETHNVKKLWLIYLQGTPLENMGAPDLAKYMSEMGFIKLSKNKYQEVRMPSKESLLNSLGVKCKTVNTWLGLKYVFSIVLALTAVGCGMDNYNLRQDNRVNAMRYLDNAWNREPAYYPIAPSQYNTAPQQVQMCKTSRGTFMPCHLAD